MRCIYCLKECDEITKDHVFPKSWYPDNTPEAVQRWTAPSCFECNNKLGKVERELLEVIPLCLPSDQVEASGMTQKALRSLGFGISDSEISKKEKTIRLKRARELVSGSIPYPELSLRTFPGFGPHPGVSPEEQMAIQVRDLDKVAEKMIKGTEYIIRGRYVEDPYNVHVYFCDPDEIPNVEKQFDCMKLIEQGPGLQIRRGQGRNDPLLVLIKITIWGSLIFYGAIDKDDK